MTQSLPTDPPAGPTGQPTGLPTVPSPQDGVNQRNLRRLVVSVRASLHKLNLLIAICDNPRYRDQLIATYEDELTANGITCYQISLDRPQPSLKQSLLDWQTHHPDWQATTPTLITVRGGDELLGVRIQQPKSAQERFFFSVQWTREGLLEFPLPIVLWVTQAVAQGLAQQSPDFWSWRGGVFEFEQPRDWQPPNRVPQVETSAISTDEPLADPAELEQQIAALQATDPDSPLLSSLYQSLGETYYKRLERGIAIDRPQEEAKAIAALQSAITRQEPLPDLTLLATSLSYLGLLYKDQGRYADAEPLLQRALSICEQQLGANHPATATSLNNLALLYKSQGHYGEAEPLLVEALEIYKMLLGDRHPATASSLNNLAGLYDSMGRYVEAELLYIEALEIYKTGLRERHPDTASSLNNLAALYESQGRYVEAEPLYVEALEICKMALGEHHPHTAASLNNLAALYYTMGRYREALPLIEQAVQIFEQALPPDHPHIKNARAGLLTIRDAAIASESGMGIDL